MLIGPVPSRRLPTGISPPCAAPRPGESAAANVAPAAPPSVFNASRRFMSIAGLLVPLGLSENQPSGDDLLNELGDRDRGDRRRVWRMRQLVRSRRARCQADFWRPLPIPDRLRDRAPGGGLSRGMLSQIVRPGRDAARGLPLGTQMVGDSWQGAGILRIAHAYEQAA